MVTRWVLLIGIDSYTRGTSRPVHFGDLKGCVNDVKAFDKYFREKLGVEKIIKLISPLDQSVADQDLPTYPNIVREMRRIGDIAKTGDLVHIHYSGHGIRRNRHVTAEGGDNISGMALVPMDVMSGGAYLTGYQLGRLVKKLVKRGMRVAVTLDCCVSGRALRGWREASRTSKFEYDESVLHSDEEAEKMIEEDNDQDNEVSHRNINVTPSWLVNPENCCVITACSVNEFANEYSFSGTTFGIFTRLLVQCLQQRKAEQLPSYAKIADFVKRECVKYTNQQKPIIHGGSEFEFFGHRIIYQRPVCHIWKSDKGLAADVGWATGAAPGAVYELEIIDPDSQTPPQQLRLKKAYDYTSIMELDGDPDAFFLPERNGRTAFLKSWALPEPTYVKFQLSRENVSSMKIQKILEERLDSIPGLQVAHPDSSPLFAIGNNEKDSIIFLNEYSQPLEAVPEIQNDDDQAVDRIIYILDHLTRYRAIRDNKYWGSRQRLKPDVACYELANADRVPHRQDRDGRYNVFDGDELILSIGNQNSSRPLHVAVFGLNPTWGIDKMYPPGVQPTEETYSTQPIEIGKFSVEIPSHLKGDYIEDILRIYLYVGDDAPSWDELVLPSLPAQSDLVPLTLAVESTTDRFETETRRNFQLKGKKEITSHVPSTLDDIWTFIDVPVRTWRK